MQQNEQLEKKLEKERSTPKADELLLKDQGDETVERQATWKRINKWNLWQYFDEPGRMSDEYRRLRLQDPELQTKAATERTIALNAKKRRFPNQYDIIDREMSGVPVLVLKNTQEYPKGYNQITDKLTKMEKQREVTVYLDMPRAGTGRTIIRPGGCVPFSLLAERYVRRDLPNTVVEQYDPTNERHNADIRMRGIFASGEVN